MPWLSDSISVVMILTLGVPLSRFAKVIIELAFLPFFLLTWLTAFTDLVYKKDQKLILIIVLVLGIAFEIAFFYIIFTDFSLLGTFESELDIIWSPFILIYLFSFLAIFVTTGIVFGRESFKSDNKEIRTKGKFLITAFLSFMFGVILDASVPLEPIWVVITRLILISSAFEYYFGFILPEWMKKLLKTSKA